MVLTQGRMGLREDDFMLVEGARMSVYKVTRFHHHSPGLQAAIPTPRISYFLTRVWILEGQGQIMSCGIHKLFLCQEHHHDGATQVRAASTVVTPRMAQA